MRLRGILRFLLGALRDASPNELERPPQTMLDKYILDSSKTAFESIMAAYNSHAWNQACMQTVNFASGMYLSGDLGEMRGKFLARSYPLSEGISNTETEYEGRKFLLANILPASHRGFLKAL